MAGVGIALFTNSWRTDGLRQLRRRGTRHLDTVDPDLQRDTLLGLA